MAEIFAKKRSGWQVCGLREERVFNEVEGRVGGVGWSGGSFTGLGAEFGNGRKC